MANGKLDLITRLTKENKLQGKKTLKDNASLSDNEVVLKNIKNVLVYSYQLKIPLLTNLWTIMKVIILYLLQHIEIIILYKYSIMLATKKAVANFTLMAPLFPSLLPWWDQSYLVWGVRIQTHLSMLRASIELPRNSLTSSSGSCWLGAVIPNL